MVLDEFLSPADGDVLGLERTPSERRRHKRIPLLCLGRFMRADKTEHTCKLINVSVGGAALQTEETLELGEHIIAYFDEIGRIDGPVVRFIDGGFAIQIQATQHRREKLAAQLTWLINRRALGIPEARRHDRMSTENVASSMTLSDGRQVACRMLDISISGASVATAARPPLGSEILVGRLRAKVMRHHDQGIGVQFLDIQNPSALRRHFG
ncbi:MAG: PilZ domain-containing protein [Hyphomicrobiaceae bacterium]